jgi:hypothetical protein
MRNRAPSHFHIFTPTDYDDMTGEVPDKITDRRDATNDGSRAHFEFEGMDVRRDDSMFDV